MDSVGSVFEQAGPSRRKPTRCSATLKGRTPRRWAVGTDRIGGDADDRRDDAPGPQRSPFSWAELMAEEAAKPERRNRRPEPACSSLFEWTLPGQKAEPTGTGRDARRPVDATPAEPRAQSIARA